MPLSADNQRGFTLIEVLIAVFVLSFGVISVAALQLTALQITQQTAHQSAATQLASELAAIMRAHPNQINQPDSPFYMEYNASKTHSATPVMPCYGPHICNEAESAHFQVQEWRIRATTMLPNVRISVCRDRTPHNRPTGQLNWPCQRDHHASIAIKLGWANKDAQQNTSPNNNNNNNNNNNKETPNMVMIVEASPHIANDDQ